MKIKRFSPKQKRVMSWWGPRSADRRYDAIICDGAVRSGKTLCMGLSFVCWAMTSFRNQQFAFCGKSVVSLRRNLMQELTPMLKEMGFQCREKRSENLLVISRGGRDNRFYLMGGKDEGSAAFIQGVTLAGVLLDEAALMPRSFVEQAIARCSVQGSRLWFNCNPEGPNHWFYQEWILRSEQRNALYLHFTMEDNPSLSPKIRQRYRSSYSGAFYRRFILGEWTAAKGLIYDFFDPGRDARPVPEGELEEYVISVDYPAQKKGDGGVNGLEQVKNAITSALEKSGIHARTAYAPGWAKAYPGPVVAVGLRTGESRGGALNRYLGQRTDPATQLSQEIYGMRLELTMSLDIYCPPKDGAAGCDQVLETMHQILLDGLPSGLRPTELKWEEAVWDEDTAMFLRRGSLACSAYFVAAASEDELLLSDFILKGVVTK